MEKKISVSGLAVLLVVGGLFGALITWIVIYQLSWTMSPPPARVIQASSNQPDFPLGSMSSSNAGWIRCQDLAVDEETHRFYILAGQSITYKRKPDQKIRLTKGETGRIYATCFDPNYKWQERGLEGALGDFGSYYSEGSADVIWVRIYFRQAKPGERI